MLRSLEWIVRATNGVTEATSFDVDLALSTTDSRECVPGSLYFARRGDSADGHDYLPQALAAGARAAVVEDVDPSVPIAQIRVDDTTHALGQLAAAHLEDLRMDGRPSVVGITGSAGKTTTKDLLAAALSQSGPTVSPVRSFNNEVGMPLTVLKADRSTRFLVLEMGASGRGHITYLTDIAPLDVAVELMVGRAHLGGYESPEMLAATKQELVEGLRSDGTAVLNYDDAAVSAMAAAAPGEVLYFSAAGSDEGAAFWATHIAIEDDGCPSFVLESPDFRGRVRLRIAGAHQVSNALAVVAANYALGCSTITAVRALEDEGPVSPHRMAVNPGIRVATADGKSVTVTVIDDSYNANPDSMAAAFRTVRELSADRRVVLVLGEMLELGEESAAIHAEVGRAAATTNPAVVIVVGQGAVPLLGGLDVAVDTLAVAEPGEATQALRARIQDGDLILLKGSNGSGVWKVAEDICATA